MGATATVILKLIIRQNRKSFIEQQSRSSRREVNLGNPAI